MGRVTCAACGKLHGYCSEVTPVNDHGSTESGENNNMIPRGSSNENTNNQQQRGRRKGSGLRYLSAEMLSATHQTATITDARVQPDNFRAGQSAVVVKLKFKGEFILWTLRQGNPNLDAMGDAMGDDESTWKGHEVELYLEEDQFDGKKWIRSEVVQVTASSKRGR
jgi:hypothetical protein